MTRDRPSRLFYQQEVEFFYCGDNYTLVSTDQGHYAWGEVYNLYIPTKINIKPWSNVPLLPHFYYYWSPEIHRFCSIGTKRLVMTFMIIWSSKDKFGKLKYMHTLLYILPRDMIYYILSYIPMIGVYKCSQF